MMSRSTASLPRSAPEALQRVLSVLCFSPFPLTGWERKVGLVPPAWLSMLELARVAVRHAVPCHAIQCSAMPCCAVPCCAMPCCAMPCHAASGATSSTVTVADGRQHLLSSRGSCRSCAQGWCEANGTGAAPTTRDGGNGAQAEL